MEEQVGRLWDRVARRLARRGYPEAAVSVEQVERPLTVMFRALGGDGGLQLTTAEPNVAGGRRRLMQRVAGSANRAALAWRDESYLRVPASIDVFPTVALNRDLYLWLAALAAAGGDPAGDWLQRSQRQVRTALERFPGLACRYHALVAAHLAERPDPSRLGAREHAAELAIRGALLEPGSIDAAAPDPGVCQPVVLWLHPLPPTGGGTAARGEGTGARTGTDPTRQAERLRKRGELVDEPQKDRGLVTIRMENIFSFGEFVNVDRGSEDEDDPARSEDIARDIDKAAISRSRDRRAAAIRFDLDLPSEADDDRIVDDGLMLPEWDYRRRELVPGRCRIVQMVAEQEGGRDLPERLRRTARRLRTRFQNLAPARTWQGGQTDGEEIDLEAYQRFLADRAAGPAPERGLYRSARTGRRDLACLLLADLSLSTDAHVDNEHRVIDVIRDSLYLFAESLDACGDAFSMFGFSSRRRDPVRLHRIKDFNERYDGGVRSRIAAVKPGYYTRMGAGIRFAAHRLCAWPSARRLLLIVTDGKPNDLDSYEGRYGIEDTRMSIIETRRAGLLPFCVTIDRDANDYLPYLFGVNNYVVVDRPEALPGRLAMLYALLTR